MEDEIPDSVEDRLSLVDFDRLQRVGVVSQNHVRARIHERAADARLVFHQVVAARQPPVTGDDHDVRLPLRRRHDFLHARDIGLERKGLHRRGRPRLFLGSRARLQDESGKDMDGREAGALLARGAAERKGGGIAQESHANPGLLHDGGRVRLLQIPARSHAPDSLRVEKGQGVEKRIVAVVEHVIVGEGDDVHPHLVQLVYQGRMGAQKRVFLSRIAPFGIRALQVDERHVGPRHALEQGAHGFRSRFSRTRELLADEHVPGQRDGNPPFVGHSVSLLLHR